MEKKGLSVILDDVYFGSWLIIDTVPVYIHVSMDMDALIYHQEFGNTVIQCPVLGTSKSVWSRWVLGCVGEGTVQCGACS